MPGEVLDTTVLNIDINLGAPTVTTAGFGIPLILTPNADFTDRVRAYDSPADLAADSEADLASTTLEYKMAEAFAANGIGAFKVGRVDAGDASYSAALTAIIAEDNDWYGLVSTTRTKAVIASVAAAALAAGKFYLGMTEDSEVADGTADNVIDALRDAGNNRAMMLYYTDDEVAADAAWAAAFLRANPDTTSTTAAHKTLAGIAVRTMTAAERTGVLAQNGNVYGTLKGIGATFPGIMCGGLYADQILIRDWHQARLEEALAQLLLDLSNGNRKLPANSAGIALVEAIFRARHAAGVAAGHFEESPFTFSATVNKAARSMSITSSSVLTGAVHTIASTVDLLTE